MGVKLYTKVINRCCDCPNCHGGLGWNEKGYNPYLCDELRKELKRMYGNDSNVIPLNPGPYKIHPLCPLPSWDGP